MTRPASSIDLSKRKLAGLLAGALLSILHLPVASAQPVQSPLSPDSAPQATEVVAAKVADHTVAGLVLRQSDRKEFRHGIALFPGYPGIMRLRDEGGAIQYELKGNFLIRSGQDWVDGETLVVAVDAPSDEWGSFSQHFRSTPRYGTDVAALLGAVEQRFAVREWTFVGTSEGSISAFHAARMNPSLAKRLILTASVFSASRNGPGLSNVAPDELKIPILVVHHEDDPCLITRYKDAVEFSARSKSPLLTVKGGGPSRGNPCMAFTAHGFVGVETETVHAMRSWVKSGVSPSEAKPK